MSETHGKGSGGGEKSAGSYAEPAGVRSKAGVRRQTGVRHRSRFRQRLPVAVALAVVILVDQTAKWWAWRHVPEVKINPGGDFLTGHTVGSWYMNAASGAVLDLAGFALVSIAAVLLARRRRPLAVTISGSLMIGGWASNLLDRLGMHYLTAPGSIRGAVDFINLARHCWNLADFFIIGATPVFLLATAYVAVRARRRPAAQRAVPAAGNSRRAWAPAAVFAGAGLIVAVALGAAEHTGVTRPSHRCNSCSQPARPAHHGTQYAGR